MCIRKDAMLNTVESDGGIGNNIGLKNNGADTVEPAAYTDSWVVSTPYLQAGSEEKGSTQKEWVHTSQGRVE